MTQRRNIEWKVAEASRRPYYRYAENAFRKALIAQLEPVIAEIARSGAVNAEAAADLINEGRVQEAFEIVYGDVGTEFAKKQFSQIAQQQADDMQHMFRSFMETYVNENAGYRVTAITGTSKDYARGIISKVVADASDVGTDKLGIMIEKELKKAGGRISTWRARVIARTEVVTASNIGQQAGAEAVGMPMRKTWLATMDNRVRDRHALMNGESVGLNEDFIVGGEMMRTPGDARASAANTVNCRCALTYEVV